MTFNVSDAERLAVVRSAVAKFAMDIMAPVVCNTETGTVEVVATLKGCREHVRTKEFLWRSSTAPPTADAKDAEIAKLRAERDEAKRTLVSLFDDTKAEMKRLRADLDQARRDRNSAVECAEVLRGYVSEGKAEIAKLRAERDEYKDKANSLNRDRASARDAVFKEGLARIEAEKQLAAARAESERERMRLVACGVVAMSDTPDSLDATLAKIAADYRSASLDDVTRTVRALISARAALDGEREQHDETQRALNLGIEFAFDAADGRPGIETACEVIAKFDQRRAAEAKASRGGDHVADAGQMVAAAQEPKP